MFDIPVEHKLEIATALIAEQLPQFSPLDIRPVGHDINVESVTKCHAKS